MKKPFYVAFCVALGLFSSASMAATVSFYASKYTSGPNAGLEKDDPTFLTSTTYQKLFQSTKSGAMPFSVAYTVDPNWVIHSAMLRLKATDDNNYGSHCAHNSTCPDGPSSGTVDLGEKAIIKDLEGVSGDYATVAVNSYGWYVLGLDVKNFLGDGILNGKVGADWADGVTPPTITEQECTKYKHGKCKEWKTVTKPSPEKPDFWYKNIELVIDYDLKPVPVPAAFWLFGSALLGLTGIKRKGLVKL